MPVHDSPVHDRQTIQLCTIRAMLQHGHEIDVAAVAEKVAESHGPRQIQTLNESGHN
jgi:hypothetical protein